MDCKALAKSVRSVCKVGSRTPGGMHEALVRLEIYHGALDEVCGHDAWALRQAAYALQWWINTGRAPTDSAIKLKTMSAHKIVLLISKAASSYTSINAAVDIYRSEMNTDTA